MGATFGGDQAFYRQIPKHKRQGLCLQNVDPLTSKTGSHSQEVASCDLQRFQHGDDPPPDDPWKHGRDGVVMAMIN